MTARLTKSAEPMTRTPTVAAVARRTRDVGRRCLPGIGRALPPVSATSMIAGRTSRAGVTEPRSVSARKCQSVEVSERRSIDFCGEARSDVRDRRPLCSCTQLRVEYEPSDRVDPAAVGLEGNHRFGLVGEDVDRPEDVSED